MLLFLKVVFFAGQTSQLNDPGGTRAGWQWRVWVCDLSGEQGRHDGLPLQPHGPLQALLRQDDQTCNDSAAAAAAIFTLSAFYSGVCWETI